MGGCGCFSITTLASKRLHSKFVSAGLELRSIQADNTTVIQCWVPKRKKSSSSGSSKRAVLLIHGFGANAMWQWSSQLKELGSEMELYIPNLIFFGESTTTSPNRSEVYQAKSLMNVMEALGVHRFDVVGVSYGGFVAFRMAHLFPQAVERVVIASSGVCMTPLDVDSITKTAKVEAVSDFLLPTTPDELRKLIKLSFYRPSSCLLDCVLEDYINLLYIERREEKVELLQGLQLGVDQQEDPTPLPVLTQESLIIWGEHDQIFPVALAHKVKSHLGDKSKLVILKKASHAVQIEQAHQFNTHILEFLRRGGGKASTNGRVKKA
ncbi:hypothetical protein SELMODRAFT_101768 [Selaginella moellendorffii]|uniref:AB hydrolase-1 domain-containing protein n=1 Tax=Selaginella moellendorffii TaxID=88036 RepID=D8RU55_SELML|nr:uncharacterized protein LOC9637397 [Selaginella moellendorffii]XP_024535218.1 uncharacterized protein LOC9637397 [Selaginella moellendorffii]EFJ24350.1 hypothetical protein SELMODRAFT_101768 [Selaginella moellendorffii]|eukprot:XP_002974830.1 uncharacterized protein LOC9637397 [Selaginella moellendorffii]